MPNIYFKHFQFSQTPNGSILSASQLINLLPKNVGLNMAYLAWLYLIIECVEYLSLLTKTLHGQEGPRGGTVAASPGFRIAASLPGSVKTGPDFHSRWFVITPWNRVSVGTAVPQPSHFYWPPFLASPVSREQGTSPSSGGWLNSPTPISGNQSKCLLSSTSPPVPFHD